MTSVAVSSRDRNTKLSSKYGEERGWPGEKATPYSTSCQERSRAKMASWANGSYILHICQAGLADESGGHISLRGIGDKNEIEVLFSLLTTRRSHRTIYLLDQPLRCTLCLA